MKFPLPWIAQFCPLPADEAAVASAYTLSGSEVEGREVAEGETVFDFNITVNRPDCMSARGLAREAAALFGGELAAPPGPCPEAGAPASELASVLVEAPRLCPRYMARVIWGVRVGESPAWMQKRLLQCGLRPVNAVVDITNFVLLEMGHPLHAFDLARLEGRTVVVRAARPGEKMLFLDGVQRDLGPDHLVIADASRPVALAGVMGGEETGVTAATSEILLEGAVFDAVSVRRTSKSLGVRTDASHRFERGVDPAGPALALERCAALIAELCGGTVAPGVLDTAPGEPRPASVPLRPSRVGDLLGVPVPEDLCQAILERLGFAVERTSAPSWTVAVPTFRVDVSREADLVEEIVRIHGLGGLPTELPRLVDPVGGRPARLALEESLRDALAGAGFREAIHMSMTDPALCLAAEPGIRPVPLANPLAPAASALRTSLIAPLMGAAARNRSRGARRVALFEVGTVFLPGGEGGAPVEEPRAAALLYEDDPPPRWGSAPSEGLLHLKGRVLSALERLGARVEAVPFEGPPFHPGLGLALSSGGRRLGRMGTLAPSALGSAGIKGGFAHCAEWSLDALGASVADPEYAPFSRFPPAARDFSFLLPRAATWEAVRGALLALRLEHLKGLELVDVYEGRELPEGTRSWTFSLLFQSDEKTLTDEEIAPLAERVAGAMRDALGGVLR